MKIRALAIAVVLVERFGLRSIKALQQIDPAEYKTLKWMPCFLFMAAIACAPVGGTAVDGRAHCSVSEDRDQIELIHFESRAMGRRMPAIIKLPENFDPNTSETYTALYLLHGHDGDECNLIVGSRHMASDLNIILIQPTMEGEGGWFDSLQHDDLQYESMIIKDLIPYIDGRYPVGTAREQRGITGFSMGGQGALRLAINNPELFGAVGSISGILDTRLHPGRWGMEMMLGPADNEELYQEYSIVYSYTPRIPAIQARMSFPILIEVGRQDIAYFDSLQFRTAMDQFNVSYESDLEHDGRHGMPYLIARLPDHLRRLQQLLGNLE